MKLAVLMDDIANINPKKDSSLAMMLEADRRGWEIYTFDTTDLFAEQDKILAHASKTTVVDHPDNWFEKQSSQTIELGEFDAILMRKDPPFNMDYIYATYLLEQAENNDQDRSLALDALNKPLGREGYEAFYGEDGLLYIRHIGTKTLSNIRLRR
jgi:glutathione synthase